MSANAWYIGTVTRRRKGGLITTYLIEDEWHRIVAELPESEFSHTEQSRNADLICEAVNRIDYMRGLVRRLVSSLSVHHSATMAAVMSNREEFDADAALLREARAAIGEGAGAK